MISTATQSDRSRGEIELEIAGILTDALNPIERPVRVAVGGPGGTGKSSFCRRLASHFSSVAILTLDDYKTPRAQRQSRQIYGAHPEANDIETIQRHLDRIAANQTFKRPVYNSATGEADSFQAYVPAELNLIDGEISTYPQLRDRIDFSIFIDSCWKTQLNTRITRDIDIRGYTPEKAIATFLQSNLREFKQFGAATREDADLCLYCHSDYTLEIVGGRRTPANL